MAYEWMKKKTSNTVRNPFANFTSKTQKSDNFSASHPEMWSKCSKPNPFQGNSSDFATATQNPDNSSTSRSHPHMTSKTQPNVFSENSSSPPAAQDNSSTFVQKAWKGFQSFF
ncbi:hypothetical protein ACE6H2_021695 [Prunus campanulata]